MELVTTNLYKKRISKNTMVWHKLSPWAKGWSIGFMVGIIQPLWVIANYFTEKQNNLILLPSSAILALTKIFSPCTACNTRLMVILFTSPFIYAILGLLIASIIIIRKNY